HQRWVDEGRGDLDVFAASTDTRWRRQRPNAVCRVDACGYGVARAGLCQLHFQRWDRGGQPDLAGWLSDSPSVKEPAPGARCRIEGCELWPRAALPFCHAHAMTWKRTADLTSNTSPGASPRFTSLTTRSFDSRASARK